MKYNIGFIGCGNMGSALARAVHQQMKECSFLLADLDPKRAKALAEELDGQVGDNELIARECRMIFLGVKPQMMADMLARLSPILSERELPFTLVSMAAGLSCADIRAMAGLECPVIRIMPSLPISVGAGVVQVCSLGVNQEELDRFKLMLNPVGLVDELPEHLIDAASAVSGCGPAFVCLFLEGLADGAVACGLPREKATRYAAQILEGSARLLLQSGQHPGALKDAVCSPGGTTIQGVRTLEEHGFRAAAMDAVIAAYEKTLSLAKK